MKRGWQYIQLLILLVTVVLLYSFSSGRNSHRGRQQMEIAILHEQNLFVTEDKIRSMVTGHTAEAEQVMDSLDLYQLEKNLKTYGLIADAEVYETVTKNVGIEITQREPLARVMGTPSYYLDTEGAFMPLSDVYTARVPLVGAMDSLSLAKLFPLLRYIEGDPFLKKQVVSIEKDKAEDYILKLRQLDFEVNFGNTTAIEKKMNNFKAFYKKAKRDSLLKQYSLVNLKYTNQVVCTKTEV